MSDIPQQSATPIALSQATGTFDVAISFTSRDPQASELAAELARRLRARGLRVFYFRSIEEAARILGERLSEILPAVYRDRSRVVVLVGSQHYGQSSWTELELKAALDRPRDEDGQARIVPISADGARVPNLPVDIVHLGENVSGAIALRAAVDLLANRCGYRGERLRVLRIVSALVLSGVLLLAQFRLAGAPAGLTPWTIATFGAACGWSLLIIVVPAVWIARRRKRAGNSLRVVTEGPRLTAFRRYSWTLATAWLGFALIVSALFIGQWIEARLTARDIKVLISEGTHLPALNRIEANSARLGDLRESLFDAVRQSSRQELTANHWLTFPAVYAKLCALRRKRDPELERIFWKASGAEDLRPGEDGFQLIRTADELAGPVPDLADRLIKVALARQLEYLMADNDFYYGFEGSAAWKIYRRLGEVPGKEAWLRDNATPALGDLKSMSEQIGGRNLGLSARLIVHRMLHGDVPARQRVLQLLSLQDFAPATAEEVSEVELPKRYAAQTEPVLLRTWTDLHAQPGPIPDGFVIARALANLRTPAANAILLEATDSANEQERAHAVAGLSLILARGDHPKVIERIQRTLDKASEDPAALVRYTLTRSLGEAVGMEPSAMGRYLADRLQTFLQITNPSADQIEAAKTSLDLYRGEPRIQPDAALIKAVEMKLNPGSPSVSDLPNSFEALAAHYDHLGPPPGSSDGAALHVDALRHFGRIGDPRAIPYLKNLFPKLAHGNMRIGAAESLWLLQGNLGDLGLHELRNLTNLKSSIYRYEAVGMLSRHQDRIRHLPRTERDQVLSILDQVVNTGEATERAEAIRLLGALDPQRAWSAASRLTNSNSKDDQLVGIALLLELWPSIIRDRQTGATSTSKDSRDAA